MNSQVLSEDDLFTIELWKRGRKLSAVVQTEAWEIISDTLKGYVDSAQDDLMRLPPGDPAVMTAHAAASALTQQYKLFLEDIDRAVSASLEVPEALRETLMTQP